MHLTTAFSAAEKNAQDVQPPPLDCHLLQFDIP